MSEMWTVLSSYPTGLYSILLMVLLFFWALTIIGAMDIDIISFDVDFEADSNIPAFAGLLHTLGLTGVPFSIVISILIFISWVITYLISNYIIVLIPGSIFKFIASSITLIAAFFISVPITVKIISPLKKLSAENKAKTKVDFLGEPCKVTTLTVDETFGQGRINTTDGDEIIVSIRADKSLGFKKGDIVRAIDYEAKTNTYQVISNEEFEK